MPSVTLHTPAVAIAFVDPADFSRNAPNSPRNRPTSAEGGLRLGGGLGRRRGRLRHLPGRRHQVRQGGGRLHEAERRPRLQGDDRDPGGFEERPHRRGGRQRELHWDRERCVEEVLP